MKKKFNLGSINFDDERLSDEEFKSMLIDQITYSHSADDLHHGGLVKMIHDITTARVTAAIEEWGEWSRDLVILAAYKKCSVQPAKNSFFLKGSSVLTEGVGRPKYCPPRNDCR
jgi:hypothetical protein